MFYLDKAISSSQYNSYLVIWVIASSISGNVSSGKQEQGNVGIRWFLKQRWNVQVEMSKVGSTWNDMRHAIYRCRHRVWTHGENYFSLAESLEERGQLGVEDSSGKKQELARGKQPRKWLEQKAEEELVVSWKQQKKTYKKEGRQKDATAGSRDTGTKHRSLNLQKGSTGCIFTSTFDKIVNILWGLEEMGWCICTLPQSM